MSTGRSSRCSTRWKSKRRPEPPPRRELPDTSGRSMADIDNIQALVVRSPVKPEVSVLLFKLGDAAAARGFVREYAAKVPKGAAADVAGNAEYHLLFCWSGLEKMLRGHPTLDVAEGRRA